LAAVRAVLVRPESGANVGAVARVVRNTGLSGLDLVAPCDYRTVECWRTAWGAQEVLESARVFASLREALAGTSLALAFTGKRDRGAPIDDVRDAAQVVAEAASDAAVALVFGCETAGLTREEMALCGRRAPISTRTQIPLRNKVLTIMVFRNNFEQRNCI